LLVDSALLFDLVKPIMVMKRSTPPYEIARLLKVFGIVVLALASIQLSYGLTQVLQVTPATMRDPNDSPPPLVIKITNTADSVKFRVIVTGRDNTTLLAGTLSIYREGKLISSCLVSATKLGPESKEVDKTVIGKSVVFEFSVSPDFLAESKFQIYDQSEPPTPPAPVSGVAWWFYLKDFASAK
jgi:hypothetical protein